MLCDCLKKHLTFRFLAAESEIKPLQAFPAFLDGHVQFTQVLIGSVDCFETVRNNYFAFGFPRVAIDQRWTQREEFTRLVINRKKRCGTSRQVNHETRQGSVYIARLTLRF